MSRKIRNSYNLHSITCNAEKFTYQDAHGIVKYTTCSTTKDPKVQRDHRMCSVKKDVLKHLCWSLFFNKVSGIRPATLLKKKLQYWCFPVNFAKFLKHLFHRTSSGDCFQKYNAFLANSPILHFLETSINIWFSGVFRGYKWENWSEMG